MRRIRYSVAASLDGYIAGPNGEFDWIVQDPESDFGEMFAQFDTFLVGRKTFETLAGGPKLEGKVIVFSRTLRPEDHPGVTIVAEKERETVEALRGEPGKDIWLFGGGEIFRSLLDAGLVDTVEVAIIPILLGGGIPLLPSPAQQTKLRLTGRRVYEATGIVSLRYDVLRP
jgi:dihydrofolate reductase